MRYFDYSPMHYQAAFWPEGFISLAINILIWGGIIYLFIFFMQKMSHAQGGCCGIKTSKTFEENDVASYLDIIKMRYAKGEIDKKQFEEMKKDLSE